MYVFIDLRLIFRMRMQDDLMLLIDLGLLGDLQEKNGEIAKLKHLNTNLNNNINQKLSIISNLRSQYEDEVRGGRSQ